MEIEFTQRAELLDSKGRLISGGWSRGMLLGYDRSAIPPIRRFFRLKEHDSYTFGNDRVQVSVTIADNGIFGLISATVAKLDIPCEKTTTKYIPIPAGRLGLHQSTDEGDILYRSAGVSLDLCKSPGTRYVRLRIERFDDVRPLYINMTLNQPPADSMCIAIPFAAPGYFYYAHKMQFASCFGTVVYGADTFDMREDECTGRLDWGRGIIPRGSSFLHCCACGKSDDGHDVGINFGVGSGDRTSGGENIIFRDGAGHKFGGAEISHGSDLMTPWRINSIDRRAELCFEPILELRDPPIWGILSPAPRRIYGRFSGTANLGGGEAISLTGVTGHIDYLCAKGQQYS